jgi:Flp pilus assembly pilin Flp
MQEIRTLLRQREGQDVVEYALLAAFISILAILTVKNIRPFLDAAYDRIQAAFDNGGSGRPPRGPRHGMD